MGLAINSDCIHSKGFNHLTVYTGDTPIWGKPQGDLESLPPQQESETEGNHERASALQLAVPGWYLIS